MAHLFSPAHRFKTWRELWLNLAIAEKQLGLPIPDEALEQMKSNLSTAYAWIHAFPTSTAYNCGQTRYSVDPGSSMGFEEH
ncbi:uncharacterized protein F5147DRAFT_701964 [Suillus discolor]|uniref:Adenylosuccinate lyase n=1 Tax=Suillus discolor TaxID=1912936 RepID=A0A9P7JSP4_9AGAM|nr:uncharacterized protein F5147DRAFT_701964 [Suillus discolor]KAG2105799.1 hypothetical protein F5147DRAFT_701964 [Suillus discolor]